MPEQPTNEIYESNDPKDTIPHNQFGFKSANDAKSKPESIVDGLEKVYEKLLVEQMSKRVEMIQKAEAEIELATKRKNELSGKLEAIRKTKELKEKEIEELNIERIEVRNGDGETGDTIPFVIGAFITLLLTMYLFVFYSSSGYSTFYGIKPGSLGFINPNVFTDAINRGGGVIALIILFPVIFIGLGFFIHVSLEKNKKLAEEGKPKQYAVILSLVFFTLIVDAFIGYKISEGVHTNEFNAGLTNETWKLSMIYSDINFYLILALGFVVYLIWGFLLNYVLSHPYLKTESEKVKLLVENIDKRVNEKRSEVDNITSSIHQLESDIKNCDLTIGKKENNLIKWKSGRVIPVDIDLLKAKMGEFMAGWENFTHGHWGKAADELNTSARLIKENWLEKKIKTLEYDL